MKNNKIHLLIKPFLLFGLIFFIVCGPISVVEVLCGKEDITLEIDLNDDFEENEKEIEKQENEKKIIPELSVYLFKENKKKNTLSDQRPSFVRSSNLECTTPPPKC